MTLRGKAAGARARRFLLGACLGGCVAAYAGGACDLINDNGDFSSELDGWTVTPTVEAIGEFSASQAQWGVLTGEELEEFLGSALLAATYTFEDDMLAMKLFATTSSTVEGQTTALAQLDISTEATITNRYLRFTTFGDFEFEHVPQSGYALEYKVTVSGRRGQSIEKVFHAFDEEALGEPCDPDGDGFFVLLTVFGVLQGLPGEFYIDVLGSGQFEIGDDVTVTMTLSAEAESHPDCQFQHSETVSRLAIDRFEFCSVRASLADLNGDFFVGPPDLAMLLGAWGRCEPSDVCSADLDTDGTVGPADLAILLGEWGSVFPFE